MNLNDRLNRVFVLKVSNSTRSPKSVKLFDAINYSNLVNLKNKLLIDSVGGISYEQIIKFASAFVGHSATFIISRIDISLLKGEWPLIINGQPELLAEAKEFDIFGSFYTQKILFKIKPDQVQTQIMSVDNLNLRLSNTFSFSFDVPAKTTFFVAFFTSDVASKFNKVVPKQELNLVSSSLLPIKKFPMESHSMLEKILSDNKHIMIDGSMYNSEDHYCSILSDHPLLLCYKGFYSLPEYFQCFLVLFLLRRKEIPQEPVLESDTFCLAYISGCFGKIPIGHFIEHFKHVFCKGSSDNERIDNCISVFSKISK